MRCEMRQTLTALLLSCELAMSVPDVPVPAVERIRRSTISHANSDCACKCTETLDADDGKAAAVPGIMSNGRIVFSNAENRRPSAPMPGWRRLRPPGATRRAERGAQSQEPL
jgi:hypothetical protein